MVEENEVSLQTNEDLYLNTQTLGEKRENGFLETSLSGQSMRMPNFMTPSSTTFIVYALCLHVCRW